MGHVEFSGQSYMRTGWAIAAWNRVRGWSRYVHSHTTPSLSASFMYG